ncbi:histone acetyltransferase type B catalytic subunit-like isoform X2 [Photinus pyralis]|nr:histone acetyltransferase type B catalytic subunit-like isoform X2 [Photinus pyralis]XP_031336087.1 histone acetyltransferase type B catalytic subunit-like isoform X2 [Photinus pyralis]XP_031336088.1 histone acetyltransferase type B catalytic subunit-like isoform X2 [Photinus pyralis]XP_031336089.1 histone acetyltransferase type B catalytic subunit-like isoform X2 [Photinus pyralis]XP_031336090.1 histone acetyltransferase type B catalytic subunit-like isoform X2 [Photinus pyralis]XP_0313360
MSRHDLTPCIRKSKYAFLVRNLVDKSRYSQTPIPETQVLHDLEEEIGLLVELGLETAPDTWWISPAVYAVTINIVFSRRCLPPAICKRNFKPTHVKQVFGDRGEIYGYRNLRIDIYYLANSAKCYVDTKYTSMANPAEYPTPDDILAKLSPWLPDDYKTNINDFMVKLYTERRFQMFGAVVERVQIYNPTDEASYKYIFTCPANDDPLFKQFHVRFQRMTVWFFKEIKLDNVQDPNWIYLYVYEERKNKMKEVESLNPVGFISIYKYFHYPNRVRARIMQLFVIPPCQGMGIGSHLLRNAYREVASLDDVVDITVLEPNVTFTRVRDFLDCHLLMEFPEFDSNNVHQGFSESMFQVANREYKLNRRQVRRAYEILRLSYIECNVLDPNYTIIWGEVVNRLKNPFVKRVRILEKHLQKHPNDNQSTKDLQNLNRILEDNVIKYMNSIQVAATALKRKLLEQCLDLPH